MNLQNDFRDTDNLLRKISVEAKLDQKAKEIVDLIKAKDNKIETLEKEVELLKEQTRLIILALDKLDDESKYCCSEIIEKLYKLREKNN